MNKYSLTALSVAGGALSALAWTSWCTGLILLVSFVPFLVIEDHLFRNPKRFSPNAYFHYLLPGFVLFTILTLGWVRVASIAGALTIIMGMSMVMAFTLWLVHLIRIKAGNRAGNISFIVFWLAFEFICLNFDVLTPWLNLGNGLSGDLAFIQWYDVTGVSGGTLWILLSNLLMAKIILYSSMRRQKTAIWILILIVPSALSFSRYQNIEPSSGEQSEVVTIQPNVDPYTEKFVIPFREQLAEVIVMAQESITKETSWVVTPETTVDDPIDLDSVCDNEYVTGLRRISEKHSGISVVAGMVSMKKSETGSTETIYFNSAFKIDTGKVEVYHKSKLIPGIEMQLINGPGRLIGRVLPYLGGTRWGYGTQEERSVLKHGSLPYSIAPVICYESVYGEYVTEYIRKGAKAIFIITNDGWWKNTRGYLQHLSYASLRAIETRRPVIRSANTGISCIIGLKGNRIQESEWWTKQALRGSFTPESRVTFYVRLGDYILRIAALTAAVIILAFFIAVPVRNKIR